jgi:hypothetical protein
VLKNSPLPGRLLVVCIGFGFPFRGRKGRLFVFNSPPDSGELVPTLSGGCPGGG